MADSVRAAHGRRVGRSGNGHERRQGSRAASFESRAFITFTGTSSVRVEPIISFVMIVDNV
jgi:hypothetical protein